MATKEIYLNGKLKWCKLITPDAKFGNPKWSVVLYPDASSYDKIMEMKKMPGGIKNVVKKDEDGYSMTFSRPTQKTYKGALRAFTPPVVLDGSKKQEDGSYPVLTDLIGNGSDGTIKISYYDYTNPLKQTEHACRLESVRVDSLIPYTPKRDFTDEQTKMADGMEKQPAPLF